ncbi:hypothetical protein TCAL_02451 [Tigriopus californicus]|uniref:C2H2-type domain-containing protein n=1 Tax=Tigriopus californicus TaxID=6832 RepID=A0A553NXY9_TIGCA|nr:hypothetical protein TCAL_02451 [Tigriopus californicus]|eukprot:TCALIF_02451-PA protein Name:"Similar to ZNF878 Zinc finger protein 878 (Homo sapiens)" AED:0.04 eAED:0.04 QI:0/1/0.5/1/1/1/2/479/448
MDNDGDDPDSLAPLDGDDPDSLAPLDGDDPDSLAPLDGDVPPSSWIQLNLPLQSIQWCPKCGHSPQNVLAHLSDCFQSPESFQISLDPWEPFQDKATRSRVPPEGLGSKQTKVKVKVKRVQSEKKVERRMTVKRAKHECPVCFKKFRSAQYLPDHMNTHTGERPYQCDKCDKTFRNRTVLRQHLSTHSLAKTYQCDKCDKTFKRLESLRYHESSHSTARPWICPTCGKTFRNDKDLRIHERTVHSDQVQVKKETSDKPKSCELCAETFKNYNAYHYHKKTKHCLGHTCVKCDFVAPTQGQLDMHMRKHTGEKPFSCRFCDKKFTRASLRKVHEARHTGNSLFSCTTCGKGFPQKSELRSHERTHESREKVIAEQLECGACGECVDTKADYEVHLRLHQHDVSTLGSIPEQNIGPTEDIFQDINESEVLGAEHQSSLDYNPCLAMLKNE